MPAFHVHEELFRASQLEEGQKKQVPWFTTITVTHTLCSEQALRMLSKPSKPLSLVKWLNWPIGILPWSDRICGGPAKGVWGHKTLKVEHVIFLVVYFQNACCPFTNVIFFMYIHHHHHQCLSIHCWAFSMSAILNYIFGCKTCCTLVRPVNIS